MGVVRVPRDSYYGAQTKRASDNFPISGLRFQTTFIRSLALIKKCAAKANLKLGIIEKKISNAIVQAASEVQEGKFNDQFIVDIFQTGSGTSTNMNMNEVISTRANEILTGERRSKFPVHPNDHVNSGQSSNDTIPSAIHISALDLIENHLIPSLKKLHDELKTKSQEFARIEKIGRTHLQDAVPMTLGNEFSGYARQVELGIQRIKNSENTLFELALGGTAVGTGINSHPDFADEVIKLISKESKLHFIKTKNHFEAQSAQDAAVETSGILKTIAVSLVKIANDLRWLSSGPRCGLGEINLPSLQPGSSIMPGKINPVIPEAVLQVAAQVIGNDSAITFGGQAGNFELNVMLPVIGYNLIQSIELLSTSATVLAIKCVTGIEANEEKCRSYIEQSLALATGLIPHIGYDRASEIAKRAYNEGKTVREIISQEPDIPKNLI